MTSEADMVGYGKPPRASRFQKGQSGNPKGRPKNRRKGIPYDGVLGHMVTIREDGRERRVTAAEAFLLQLTRKGLAGDSAAARASLEAIETARASRTQEHAGITVIVMKSVSNGADAILEELGLAQRKYPTDQDRVRWQLSPWVVEGALGRIGERRLSASEQREVWANVRTPQKVRWPDWWTERN